MNKEKEAAMNETYRQFIEAGLGLNSEELLNDIVDDKLMGFGTTADEKIFNLNELKELLSRQKEQSKNIDLNWEIKPVSHYTSADENTAFFADDIFLDANVGGEPIRMYLRFSVVLSYVNKQWKVIHWHGSKPENVQSEEDTFGIENWKQKAQALEKQVAERTADLVVKNRELEIEASLERVRGVAMGMHKPDDLLNICEVYFNELKALGFTDIRNALIHIFNDEKGYYYDYDYSDFTSGKITHLSYKGNATMEDFLAQIRKSDDAFVEVVFDGKKLEEWKDFRKKSGQIDDERINAATQLNYYFYSFGAGNIGFSNFGAVDNNKLEILKHFRNVFRLAYSRFIDIRKAEAQSREAQIELALERVRARTMAMQRSTELQDTALLLVHQVKALGVQVFACGFNIWDDDRSAATAWMAGEDRLQPPFKTSTSEDVFLHIHEAAQRGETLFVAEQGGQELETHYRYMASIPVFKDVMEKMAEAGLTVPTFQIIHCAFFSQGYLMFISFNPVPEAHDIFKRFAKVFEQTYTRFLDLEKAEAQAKESQIQLALERVRARTMAMQRSDELMETAVELFNQLNHLGENIERTIIGVINEEERIVDFWATRPDGSQIDKMQNFPIDEPIVMQKVYSAWRQQKKSIVIDLRGEELESYFRFLKAKGPRLKRESFGERRVESFAFFSKGFLGVISADPQTPANTELYERFAAVFDQTYTRFLDLHKAEGQARDAQLEAALERVRSRSLAMHNTFELQQVIHTVHRELLNLKIAINGGSFIAINNDVEAALRCWGSGGTADTSEEVLLPFYDKPFCTNLISGIKNGPGFFTEEFTQKEKMQFFTFLFKHEPWSKLESERKNEVLSSPGGYTRSCCVSQYTSIFIINHFGERFSNEENDILKRFANVFEQAYTRFLDLQKAEAQAREAQVELALERVRSRAMMMQKSEDLSGAVSIVFEELNKLSIGLLRCGIGILHKEKRTADVFTTTISDNNSTMQVSGDESMDIHPLLHNAFEAWLRQEDYEYVLRAEDLNDYYKALTQVNFTLPQSQSLVTSGDDTCQYYYNAMFLFGGLFAFSDAVISNEAKKIMKRFANVFEQTYTRFLDIKRAEAQAREAKIETALEKVRSRSLAMHKSDELQAVVNTLFERLQELNFEMDSANIAIFKEGTRDFDYWVASDFQKRAASFHMPYTELLLTKDLIAARESGTDFSAKAYSFEEKNEWFDYAFKNTDFKFLTEERKQFILDAPAITVSIAFSKYTGVQVIRYSTKLLSEEEAEILRRFSKVF